MKTNILLVIAAAAISSCATTGLYDWGSYEDALFDYYHQPETKDEMVADLVKHLDKVEKKNLTPAPGLMAEAGTFYLLEGDRLKAISFYQKEASYWPESQAMMNKLITNLGDK